MDIKELAKAMTREQFLLSKVKGYGRGGRCPRGFKLKEFKAEECGFDTSSLRCKECWNKALKKIKFKGEDEMKKFNWEDRKNAVIHCDTEEKAADFLKECDKRGLKWGDIDKATSKTYWEGDKDYTCYRVMGKYLLHSSKSFYEGEGYKIFDWEIAEQKESEPKEPLPFPEPKELFTFQEVIANIKEGEKYIAKSKIYCLETIEKTSGYFKFTGQLKPDRLVVDHDRTFYKEELKHTYVIHKVKHTPEGTPNSYRNPKIEEAINDNVICNTEKGKIYGRKVSSEVIQMTEKEYLNYPIIENINE